MADVEHWRLPGAQRWLDAIAEERAKGSSGLVVCPSGLVPAGMAAELFRRSQRQTWDVELAPEVDLGSSCDAPSVRALRAMAAVCHQIGHDPTHDIRSFAREPDLGRAAFVIDARAQPWDEQQAWICWANEFAAGSLDLPRAARPTAWALVAPGGAGDLDALRPEVNLKVRWWWGVLSPVDASVAAGDFGYSGDVAAIVAEIARWDLDLYAEFESWSGSLEELEAMTERWEIGIAATVLPDVANRTPRPAEVELWTNGLVESWAGDTATHVKLDLSAWPNSAVLRMWAAQVARVMPFIELERTRLADWLCAQIAATGGPREEWAEDDIASLEIGPLWACVGAHPAVHVPRPRLELIRELRTVRNALAHRTPIPTSRLDALRRQAQADRRSA